MRRRFPGVWISYLSLIHIFLRAEKKGAHTFLNPGSVSLPKEGNIPTYAILEDGVFTIKGFDGTVVKQLTL